MSRPRATGLVQSVRDRLRNKAEGGARLRPGGESSAPEPAMEAASASGLFVAGSNPNTIDHLTAVQLRHYRFPFPPRAEQEVIAQHLDQVTDRLENLRGNVERAIDRLREYRTALISAAVTGKIDVREELQ